MKVLSSEEQQQFRESNPGDKGDDNTAKRPSKVGSEYLTPSSMSAGTSSAEMTKSTSSSNPTTYDSPPLPHLPNNIRPTYQHSTSFPIVSNTNKNHLFTLLPDPTAQQESQKQQALENHNVRHLHHSHDAHQKQPQNAAVNAMSYSSASSPPNTVRNESSGLSDAKSVSEMASSAVDDDDGSKLKTLRYNWSDYEDRLLLKIVLSSHRVLHDLKTKPLKRFWELVAEAVKQYAINAKVSRTHRQCRERFYILYAKAVKFAEQLGIDPSTQPRRTQQGLSFTEAEQLYLRILQVLKLEDGFKLVVNEEFYKDPEAVELFDKSVALETDTGVTRVKAEGDETTVSFASSKSSDKEDSSIVKQQNQEKQEQEDPSNVIHNITSQKHKITPTTSTTQQAPKRSKYSAYSKDSANLTPSSASNSHGSSHQGLSTSKPKELSGNNDLMPTPPITRLNNRSYSSLSSGVSLRANVDADKPSSFLKNKKSKDSPAGNGRMTNVDDSSNSSLNGSSTNSQGESNGENELNENGERVEDDIDEEDEEDEEDEVVSQNESVQAQAHDLESKKYHNAFRDSSRAIAAASASAQATKMALGALTDRMNGIDSSISSLNKSISSLDAQVKHGLNEAFDRIAKYQAGIDEITTLIKDQFQHNKQAD